MKRSKQLFFLFTGLLFLLALSHCGGEKATGGKDLLSYIPADALGVVSINFKTAIEIEAVQEMLEQPNASEDTINTGYIQNYQDFVDKTGIDLKTDVQGAAIGIYASESNNPQDNEGVAVVNLKYDPDKVVETLKEAEKGIVEETYRELTLYVQPGVEEKPAEAMAFLEKDILLLGSKGAVLKAVDHFKDGGDSIISNPILNPYIKEMDAAAIINLAVIVPESVKAENIQGGLFSFDLSQAEAMVGFLNHTSFTWTGELKIMSKDEEGNNQIVSTLNGIKGIGAMADPDLGEFLNNLVLTADTESITMSFQFSDELLLKLQQKMNQK